VSQQGRLRDKSIETLTGDIGGPVGPDSNGNVNLLSDSPYSIVGNPATHTLFFDDDGTIAYEYVTDSGTAVPSANSLNVLGGTGIETAGSGNTVTISVLDDVLEQVTTDSGIAVPASNNLNLFGGNGIGTIGAGDTVTVAMESPFIGNFQFTGQVTADAFITDDTVEGLTITSNSITADGSSADIDIDLIPKGDGGTYTPRLKVNYLAATNDLIVNGTTQTADVIACNCDGTTVIQYAARSVGNTANIGPRVTGLRARGVAAAPTVVQSGDNLLDIYATGFDGTDFALAGLLECAVDGTPGNNDMPGRWVFSTSSDNTQTLTEALRIDSSQNISFTQYTQNSLSYFGASGLVTEIGPLTDGQLIIGSTGNPPQAATLTAGSGINITNGAGSVTIETTSGGTVWVVETGTTRNLAPEEGVFANNGAGVTLTLPATAAVGDTFQVVAMDAAGFTVDYGAGQSIRVGSSVSTTTTGNVASTGIGDWIEIVCNVANTGFFANVKQGNVTVT